MPSLLRHSRRIARGMRRRLWPPPPQPPQLEMIWPADAVLPVVDVPAAFELRTYTPQDEAPYLALLERAGMGRCPLDFWLQRVVPDGFFVIESVDSENLVAACFASHHPAPRHPFGGNLGWLAADPAFAGRGLGRAATAAVVNRLVRGGYRRIYLTTDDGRLPALAVYLRMGWLPLLYAPDMHGRWARVCEALRFPFTPERWPAA